LGGSGCWLVDEHCASDYLVGELSKSSSRVACVGAKQCERRVHGQGFAFGQNSLGLFDDDSAAQCAFELFHDDFAAGNRAFLDDSDRGRVGESLCYMPVILGQVAVLGVEQVQCADDVLP
jgi:hypothetical protein